MCGIFGIYNFKKIEIDKVKVQESTLLMKHRGPDAFNQWGIDGLVEISHVRLSIIDLTEDSNQPFISICGNFIISFNGEIYNYTELKDQLIDKGIIFKTRSDTEVLLNSYIYWGDDCVNKFNGDWAFSIYDIKKNRLFCSRDRFGVKPFCYSIYNNSFIFSSEIKSIINYYPGLKKPNYNIINNYCRNSLGGQHFETWFENILRLKPAHNLIIENGQIIIRRYWNYPTIINKNINLDFAKTKYLELFNSAIKIRMRSDVPLGTTLSSGIDSGSIVSFLRKWNSENLKTYTAVFNSDDFKNSDKKVYNSEVEIDETILVKKLANDLNLDSDFIDCTKVNFIKELESALYHLESGHSSPAVLPLSKIMEKASKDVKVILEGQGADELMSGYIINTFPALIISLFKKLKIKKIFIEYKAFVKHYSFKFSAIQYVRLFNSSIIERMYHFILGIDKIFIGNFKTYKRLNDYPKDKINFDENFNEVLHKSHTGSLVNLLHYGDAISMSKSIESRLPFLDYRLVEFLFTLPIEFKIKNGLGKVIHRESLKSIVPDYILNNPIKFGFNTPLSIFFNSFSTDAIKILLSDKVNKRGLFNQKELKLIINRHINNEHDYSTFLFRLLSVELWFQIFIDKR
jgi:asparagine synthase (glutamine-hydrolysing)